MLYPSTSASSSGASSSGASSSGVKSSEAVTGASIAEAEQRRSAFEREEGPNETPLIRLLKERLDGRLRLITTIEREKLQIFRTVIADCVSKKYDGSIWKVFGDDGKKNPAADRTYR